MEFIEADEQFFIRIDYDRKRNCPVIIYSRHGGLTIEKIEKRFPESINKIFIDAVKGIEVNDVTQVAKDLGIVHKQSSLVFLIKNLYECFVQRDLLQITVNPLILKKNQDFTAGNVAIYVDPSALYRQ